MAFFNTQSNKVTPQQTALEKKKPGLGKTISNVLFSTMPGPLTTGLKTATALSSAAQNKPTAAQSTVSGRGYYENLSTKGTPAEQQAAKGWLARNPVANTNQMNNQGTITPPLGGGGGGLIQQPQQQQGLLNRPEVASSRSDSITPMSAARAVYQAGELTPWESAAAENVANARGMQNFGQFAPNAEAPFYAGAGREQMQSLITRPDLVGRAGSQEDLYNKFANLYGTQANIGLQAAQTAAGRGLQGATSVLGAALPGQVGLTSTVYNPLQGAQGAGSIGDRATQAAQVSSLGSVVQKYNDLLPVTQSIAGIEGLVKNILGTSNINAFDVNAINQAVNKVRSNVSDPNYAQFQNYITSLGSLYSSYLARNGGETETTRKMAGSLIDGTANAQTISAVLNALKQEADVVTNAYYNQSQNIQSGLNQGTGITPPGGQAGFNDTWAAFGM